MITRDNADDTLQRVGLVSLMYYPEIHVDEPDYELTNDIDWCAEPLAGLPGRQRDSLRELIGRTIVDPTAHRSALFGELLRLAPDPE